MGIEESKIEEILIRAAFNEALQNTSSAYSLLKIPHGATPSIDHDPIHYFTHAANQSPQTIALQRITESAYAMLSDPAKKEIYDRYLMIEHQVYSAVKDATRHEVAMEVNTWPETWKWAYKGNKKACDVAFYQTQDEFQQVIQLYQTAKNWGDDLQLYTDALPSFFTQHYCHAIEKLTQTMKMIHKHNTQNNPTPVTLKDSVERTIAAKSCDSWRDFTTTLITHMDQLKKIQKDRLYKIAELNKICHIAIGHALDNGKNVVVNEQEIDSTLKKISASLIEYINLLKKAQRNTWNENKLRTMTSLITGLEDVFAVINNPAKYSVEKLKKAGDIHLLFAQTKIDSGIAKWGTSLGGYWKATFHDTTSIKDVYNHYRKDTGFHLELAKFNVTKPIIVPRGS